MMNECGSAGPNVIGVNVECMVRMNDRGESHPKDPGVSVMLVSGLVKLTKRMSFCCWC